MNITKLLLVVFVVTFCSCEKENIEATGLNTLSTTSAKFKKEGTPYLKTAKISKNEDEENTYTSTTIIHDPNNVVAYVTVEITSQIEENFAEPSLLLSESTESNSKDKVFTYKGARLFNSSPGYAFLISRRMMDTQGNQIGNTYTFELLEDLTETVSGDAPGVDID